MAWEKLREKQQKHRSEKKKNRTEDRAEWGRQNTFHFCRIFSHYPEPLWCFYSYRSLSLHHEWWCTGDANETSSLASSVIRPTVTLQLRSSFIHKEWFRGCRCQKAADAFISVSRRVGLEELRLLESMNPSQQHTQIKTERSHKSAAKKTSFWIKTLHDPYERIWETWSSFKSGVCPACWWVSGSARWATS